VEKVADLVYSRFLEIMQPASSKPFFVDPSIVQSTMLNLARLDDKYAQDQQNLFSSHLERAERPAMQKGDLEQQAGVDTRVMQDMRAYGYSAGDPSRKRVIGNACIGSLATFLIGQVIRRGGWQWEEGMVKGATTDQAKSKGGVLCQKKRALKS